MSFKKYNFGNKYKENLERQNCNNITMVYRKTGIHVDYDINSDIIVHEFVGYPG